MGKLHNLDRSLDVLVKCYQEPRSMIISHRCWLSVEFRIQYKLVLTVFEALQEKSPAYIQNIVDVYFPSRSLRSENSRFLVKPKARTKFHGNRRFDVSAAELWNSLPAVLRLEENLTSFVKLLKTHFLN